MTDSEEMCIWGTCMYYHKELMHVHNLWLGFVDLCLTYKGIVKVTCV